MVGIDDLLSDVPFIIFRIVYLDVCGLWDFGAHEEQCGPMFELRGNPSFFLRGTKFRSPNTGITNG